MIQHRFRNTLLLHSGTLDEYIEPQTPGAVEPGYSQGMHSFPEGGESYTLLHRVTSPVIDNGFFIDIQHRAVIGECIQRIDAIARNLDETFVHHTEQFIRTVVGKENLP